ncbi:MAG: hypothetical protein KKD31_16100 [Bacteroidetes bacterium]|nr:hypothetical protein [Bacteroidota bacterium]
MKLKPIFIFYLFFLTSTLFGQTNDSTFLFGTNLIPIISTQFGGFYEKSLNEYMTFHAGLGYVFNGPGSWIKLGTDKELDKSSGSFISIGLNGHLNDKRISPLIGLRIINSLSFEEGMMCSGASDTLATPEHFTSTGYSLGIGGIIGITLKISNRLFFDLGIQKSYLLINGLCDFHSYAPGMGINWNPMRGQFISQIKYKF